MAVQLAFEDKLWENIQTLDYKSVILGHIYC